MTRGQIVAVVAAPGVIALIVIIVRRFSDSLTWRRRLASSRIRNWPNHVICAVWGHRPTITPYWGCDRCGRQWRFRGRHAK